MSLEDQILENWGLRINVMDLPTFPVYAQLRDELDRMGRLRRWLSWRMRRTLRTLTLAVQVEMINAVLELGTD